MCLYHISEVKKGIESRVLCHSQHLIQVWCSVVQNNFTVLFVSVSEHGPPGSKDLAQQCSISDISSAVRVI